MCCLCFKKFEHFFYLYVICLAFVSLKLSFNFSFVNQLVINFFIDIKEHNDYISRVACEIVQLY